MEREFFQSYVGKHVDLLINKRNINGVLVSLQENKLKLQTDFGIVQIDIEKVEDIQKLNLLKDVFVYVCKNPICNCKGIRFLSSSKKINWPCKYFKKFECPIKKICNYNQLPLELKNKFIDGMHSEIPVFQSQTLKD